MPGKNSQDWTADEDFWDEAWADMEQRLDGRRHRRGIPVWLGWSVALVLLLTTAIFTIARQEHDKTAPEPIRQERTQKKPAVAVNSAAGPEAEQQPARREQPDTTVMSESLPQPPAGNIPGKAPGKTGSVAASSPVPSRSAAGVAAVPPPVAPAPAPGIPHPAPAAPPTPPERTEAGTAQPHSAEPAAPAVFFVVSPEIQTIPEHQPVPPAFTIAPPPRSLPLGVEAGILLADRGFLPGYYAGMSTEILAARRLSFSVAIRYRKDRQRLDINPGNSTDESFQDLGSVVVAPDNLSTDYGIGQPLDEIRLTRLSLGAGASWRLFPRLRAGIGLSGDYLLSARGVTDLSVEDGVYNLVVSSDRASADFASPGQTPTPEVIRLLQSASPGVNDNAGLHRFQLQVHPTLTYRFFPRLDLTGRIDVRATPLFKSDLLKARSTQFSLGVRYRLR